MTNPRLLPVLAIAVATYACPGCDQAGCYNGLSVTLTNGPAEPYRIEAYSGGTARYVHSCTGGPCTAFFVDYLPAFVGISIVTESDTTHQGLRPNYAYSRPNGPDCPPRCLNATVTITL